MSGTIYAPAKPSYSVSGKAAPLQLLAGFLIKCSFLNLFMVACIGLLMRSFSFFHSFPLQYINIVHGHSHFAFGGWVMPILIALIIKAFPEVAEQVGYRHWRNIVILLLVAAYGMLISFPIQGYQAVSIAFSTLSVIAGYYLAIVLWKATGKVPPTTSIKFLKAGLFYLTISSIGPFATGPLLAMGKGGTPVYFDAIYFYLHFQYNGWFTFAVLALLYKLLENKKNNQNGNTAYVFFNVACIPAYFLSVLWSQPSLVFNVVGGLAALLQVVALVFLVKDISKSIRTKSRINHIFQLAMVAFSIKILLQLVSAFPGAASLAYNNRNFVIAYLHLVLLGFISLFAFGAVLKLYHLQVNNLIKWGLYCFSFAFVSTELLLISLPLGSIFKFYVPAYSLQLFLLSCLFPLSIALMFGGITSRLNIMRRVI